MAAQENGQYFKIVSSYIKTRIYIKCFCFVY